MSPDQDNILLEMAAQSRHLDKFSRVVIEKCRRTGQRLLVLDDLDFDVAGEEVIQAFMASGKEAFDLNTMLATAPIGYPGKLPATEGNYYEKFNKKRRGGRW